jgi:Na+/proline symporter
VNDLWRPVAQAGDTHEAARTLRLTRLLTAVFGAVQIAVGILGQRLDSTVVSAVLSIAGFTTGIVLGVFFLGLFTRRVGQRAALCGLLLGLALMTAVAFGTRLAWPWYALVGSLATFAFGWLASYVWDEPVAAAPTHALQE